MILYYFYLIILNYCKRELCSTKAQEEKLRKENETMNNTLVQMQDQITVI